MILGDDRYGDLDPSVMVFAPYSGVGWEPPYSDNGYADMDADHLPDLAVGRIPVRSNADGLRVLDKVRDHEGSYDPGLWNRRLNAFAGTGDFGPEIDAAIELAAQKAFEEIRYDYDIRFAYDNPASIYYYAPFPQVIQQSQIHRLPRTEPSEAGVSARKQADSRAGVAALRRARIGEGDAAIAPGSRRRIPAKAADLGPM